MSYIALVAVVDRLNDLAPEELCFKLRHLPVGLHFEVAVKATTVDILHHKEDLFMALEDLE